MMNESENGSFPPLVLSTTGGMAPTSTVVYKRIASMIASKHATAKPCTGSDAD